MIESGFRLTREGSEQRAQHIGRYEMWLANQTRHLVEGLNDPVHILASTAAMRDQLTSYFSVNYATDQDRVAIFSGKSAPLHEKIFNAAFDRAEVRLIRPQIVYFDDWQNQKLYIKRESSTPNFNESDDPLQVMASLHERGAQIAIHEDHSRLGGKYTSLIQLWKEQRLDQIYQYSGPVYPDHYWIRDFFFGIRDERYNRFFSGFSKLFSQREFFKMHALLEVFDNEKGLIPLSSSPSFDRAMESLDRSLDCFESGLSFDI